MKRLSVCLFVMLAINLIAVGNAREVIQLPQVAEAGFVIGSGAVGGGSCNANCPEDTYMFFWNGDHSNDEQDACKSSCSASTGNGTEDGTDRINATAGQTANGFEYTNVNQYIEWTITADDLLSDSQGTIWCSVYIDDIQGTFRFIESWTDSSNHIAMTLSSSEAVRVYFESGNGSEQNITGGDAISTGTWTRIAYSWQTGADAGGKHSVKVAANDWDEESDDLDDWAVAPSSFTIGERHAGGGDEGTVYIDNVYITSGYQDADPM